MGFGIPGARVRIGFTGIRMGGALLLIITGVGLRYRLGLWADYARYGVDGGGCAAVGAYLGDVKVRVGGEVFPAGLGVAVGYLEVFYPELAAV